MATVNDFTNDIVSGAGDMTMARVRSHTLGAINDFTRRTGVIRELIALQTVAGQSEVTLLPGLVNGLVSSIVSAKIDSTELKNSTGRFLLADRIGMPHEYTLLTGNKVTLWPQPDAIFTVEFTVLVTANDPDQVPDVILNEFKDAITFGALYRIANSRGGDWYDPAYAAQQYGLFMTEVNKAKADAFNRAATIGAHKVSFI